MLSIGLSITLGWLICMAIEDTLEFASIFRSGQKIPFHIGLAMIAMAGGEAVSICTVLTVLYARSL